MDEYDYDWSQASTLDFLNYRSLTAPAGNPRLTYVMPASEWARATNPQMNRTLVDTGYAEKFLFDRLSNIDRLKIALSAAIKCFPAAVQGDLMILLSASNLAKIAATLMGFIALSAIGVGQIIAMGVAAYAWWVAGNAAFDYIKAVATFARAVLEAKSEVELMQAGTKFGKATAHLSVDVIVAILTKKASVKMRESAGKIHEFAKEKKLLFGKYDVNSAQRTLPKETKKINTPPPNKPNFASRELLESHFKKHGKEFSAKNADEYLGIGDDIMKTGQKVQYNYKGETRTGYVKFLGNSSKGEAKFGFVGTNNSGNITTIHVESGNSFWKMLNGMPIDKTIRTLP